MKYTRITIKTIKNTGFLKLDSPEHNNTINDLLIEECHHALLMWEQDVSVVVLEGLQEVFCFGADFREIHNVVEKGQPLEYNPEGLYDLWLKLATGPFITVAHVRGKANAGGVGFAAACDIVIAHEEATFSLSELIFGVIPACVMPFLIKRTGHQHANYLALTTQPASATQALQWGLADVCDADSDTVLRKHLLRLRRLSKTGVVRYKKYMKELHPELITSRAKALQANKEVFADPVNQLAIYNYIEKGIFPWESETSLNPSTHE